VVFDFVMVLKKTFPGVNSTVGFENIASGIKEAVSSKYAGLALLCLTVFQSF
jgi:hypothetical protein